MQYQLKWPKAQSIEHSVYSNSEAGPSQPSSFTVPFRSARVGCPNIHSSQGINVPLKYVIMYGIIIHYPEFQSFPTSPTIRKSYPKIYIILVILSMCESHYYFTKHFMSAVFSLNLFKSNVCLSVEHKAST